jgi:hypothetical protein
MKTILIFILLICLTGFSQQANYNDSLITIEGRVVDTTKIVGFYNTVVLDKTVGKGIFGESNGKFKITVRKGDLIGVSVSSYRTVYISYKDSVYKPVYKPVIYLEMLSVQGKEVVVTRIRTLEELKEERAAIAKREVPTVTVSNAFQSPITALYVAFSKREKTKRLVAEMEYQDQQDNVVREILRLFVHSDIINLSPDDFDEFMRFLNLNPNFLKNANDYELITYIQYKFEHFQKIKEGY